jgi:hypothetical protein
VAPRRCSLGIRHQLISLAPESTGRPGPGQGTIALDGPEVLSGGELSAYRRRPGVKELTDKVPILCQTFTVNGIAWNVAL